MSLQAPDIRRISQRHGGHIPGHIADIVGAAGNGIFQGLANIGELGGESLWIVRAHQGLQGLGEALIVFRPGRQAYGPDVFVHRQGDRFIEVARPGSTDDATPYRGVGHHRGTFGDTLQGVPILADAFGGDFPNEIPDAGIGWHHVRLIAAIADDVV